MSPGKARLAAAKTAPVWIEHTKRSPEVRPITQLLQEDKDCLSNGLCAQNLSNDSLWAIHSKQL